MSENFLLSSHHLAQVPTPSDNAPFASQVQVAQSHNQHKRICVAAPAVGITVLDLADQTPLSSLTLGPSFQPSTAAVARSIPTSSAESIRVKNIRKTWVGVQDAEAGPAVWQWTEEERKDGSVESEAVKVVHPVAEPLAAISALSTLPDHLLLLSKAGSLVVASEADLSAITSSPAPSREPLSQTLNIRPLNTASSLLPRSLVALVPTSSWAHIALVVRTFPSLATTTGSTTFVDASKTKFKKSKRPSSASVIAEAEASGKGSGAATSQIEVILMDSEVMRDGETSAAIVSLGMVDVEGAEVVVSDDGFVTSIVDGSLVSYRLTLSGSIAATVYADLFTPSLSETRLLLSPMHRLPLSKSTLTHSSITLLALHSSFVLLASVKPSATSIEDAPARVAALVWDIRLGALVSDSEVSVPSAALPASVPARRLCLALSTLSREEAALTVRPSSGTTGRSLVFVVPLILPSASVLAAVVGKQALTKKYTDIPATTVTEKAKKAEAARHPKMSEKKAALLEASAAARGEVLEKLALVLKPLEGGAGDSKGAVEMGEKVFATFLEGEQARLKKYVHDKEAASLEKEASRRAAAEEEKQDIKITSKKYRTNRARIDAAIEAAPEVEWTEVTAKRIKGVADCYRYKYYEVRKSIEKSAGKPSVKTVEITKKLVVPEPTLPSSFVTALLRLCFPVALDAQESDALSPSASTRTWRHPTVLVKYLLERKAIGDGSLPGGVTRYLSRAGDWPNVQRALQSLPDIPEAVTVALLQKVVAHHASSDASTLDVEGDSLPYPPPPLRSFLASFVESPSTPAILRQAFQQQLTAFEVLPVLAVLDAWLVWWASRGGGGGELPSDSGADWKAEGKAKPKRLPINPFVALSMELEAEEATPPRVEDILPVVQAILDAHFVTLLLQQQSHTLLRRLAAHIRTHVTLQRDLSELLGALSVYARAKEEQKNKVALAKQSQALEDHKALGATMAARVAAQEKHAEVLEYSLEKFWL